MHTNTLDKHIEITPGVCGGKPRIAGHRITVQNIAIWFTQKGMSIDDIVREYHLTPADIHAALAYYHDHKAEIEQSIRDDEDFVNEFFARNPSKLSGELRERQP